MCLCIGEVCCTTEGYVAANGSIVGHRGRAYDIDGSNKRKEFGNLVTDLGLPYEQAKVFCSNQSAIRLTKDQVYHDKRYIMIR